MKWNEHSDLKDKHAVLSPSKVYWLNYGEKSEEERESKLYSLYLSDYSSRVGTLIHDFVSSRIRSRIKLPKNCKDQIEYLLWSNYISKAEFELTDERVSNIYHYVNDCIKYGMDTEVLLYYSKYCFGTTDAIIDDGTVIRIHDMKTGIGATHIEQLMTYAALYCLEYGIDPAKRSFELRIYQNDEIVQSNPEPDEIIFIINEIMLDTEIITNKIQSVRGVKHE